MILSIRCYEINNIIVVLVIELNKSEVRSTVTQGASAHILQLNADVLFPGVFRARGCGREEPHVSVSGAEFESAEVPATTCAAMSTFL